MPSDEGTLLKLEQAHKQAAADYVRQESELATKKDELRLAYQELTRLQNVAADFVAKTQSAQKDLHDAQDRYKKAAEGSPEEKKALSDIAKAEDGFRRLSQQVRIYGKYIHFQRGTIKKLEQVVSGEESKVESLKRQLDSSLRELDDAKKKKRA